MRLQPFCGKAVRAQIRGKLDILDCVRQGKIFIHGREDKKLKIQEKFNI